MSVILVVDDENGIREFLEAFLSGQFEVLLASSGEEAVELWNEHPDRVKLLITDIVMPGMNGKALAERLRSERPSLPVIFMSGYLPPEIAEQTLNGVFFKKPFNPLDLLERVNELLKS